jgi:DNA-binding MarR family transcriptional regulator
MAVLAAVAEGPASQLDLARRLDMDPSDMTATVDDLEGSRLVSRTVDSSDRRRKLVTLTRPGRTELRRLDALAREVAGALLAPVPAARRQQLHDDLYRVLVAHDHRDG